MKPISLREKFDLFSETWTPKIIAELNGQQVKLARLSGDFIWHNHPEEDELFFVVEGMLYIDFRDRTEMIGPGELIVVPKGVDHRPHTEEGKEALVMLFEPASTGHTGDVITERTVQDPDWI